MTLHHTPLLVRVIVTVKIGILNKRVGLLLSLLCSLRQRKIGERATTISKNLTLAKNQSELDFIIIAE